MAYTDEGEFAIVRHPWDTWLNGETWKLVQGVEFQTSVGSMGRMVREAADRRGLRVFVRTSNKRCDRYVVVKSMGLWTAPENS